MSFNDQYRPSGFGNLPTVTKNILIINVLIFALTYFLDKTQHIDLNKYLGLHYPLAPDFKPHQFITYLFMHGDIYHIFFNMFGVYIFGQVLENLWGPKRFIIFYFLTGLGAALTQLAITHFAITPFLDQITIIQEHMNIDAFQKFIAKDEVQIYLSQRFEFEFKSFADQYNSIVNENPTKALSIASQFLLEFKKSYLNANVIVGASGSLMGLLGAFGMLFPNQLLYVYFFIPIKAKWLVIGYGLIELFSGLSNKPGDNVAHFAHLGGLAVGLVIILIWRKNRSHFY